MAYKNILVHVDNSRSCAGRITAAVDLARAHEAHLTGLCTAVEPSLPVYIRNSLPEAALQAQAERVAEHLDAATGLFREKVEQSGVAWDVRRQVSYDIDLPRLVGEHARYADLAVLGQPDPEDVPAGERHLVELVVLQSGRPVLVVPYIGPSRTLGQSVTVAWDAGREAARAVNDALPFLERAQSVTVLVVNPRPGIGSHGEEPGADIGLHLARHGIKVEVKQIEADDIAIGEAVLSLIADLGSDLLVMGAYGHSRMRELVLGGVTRTLLREMTVPVFMSH